MDSSVLPKGIFRARLTRSRCTDRSLDLEVKTRLFPPYPWCSVVFLASHHHLPGSCHQQNPVNPPFSSFTAQVPLTCLLVWPLTEYNPQVLSGKLHSHPSSLSHELSPPTIGHPPYTSESEGGNGNHSPVDLTMTAAWQTVCPLRARLPPPGHF